MKRRELMKCTVVGAVSALAPALPGRAAADAAEERAAVPDARLTAPLTPPASGAIKVAFLIAPTAEVVDFAGPWGVFEYVTIGETYRKPFMLYTVAASREPVVVSGGMTVTPDHGFADAPAPDVVVVPAMDTRKLDPSALDWLKAVQNDAAVTMSVCNGSFVLAEAGLLDGKKATAHHGGYGMLRAMYPDVAVIRGVRYVEDGKIATAGGLTSGVDLAMRVVERYFGRAVAEKTAFSLEYQGEGWKRPASNAAFAKRPVGTADRPLDLVCESLLDKNAALPHEHEHKTYYFCSNMCLNHFKAAPERFIDPS